MTDLGFHGDPVPGWSVRLAPGTGDLRTTGPGVIDVLYEGRERGLVLITGTATGARARRERPGAERIPRAPRRALIRDGRRAAGGGGSVGGAAESLCVADPFVRQAGTHLHRASLWSVSNRRKRESSKTFANRVEKGPAVAGYRSGWPTTGPAPHRRGAEKNGRKMNPTPDMMLGC